MKGLALLGSLIVPAVLTHVSLYGWRRAPVNTVRLNRRQWATVALITAPFLAAIIVALAVCRQSTFNSNSEWPAVLGVCGLVGLLSVVCGMAPSYREEDDEPEQSHGGTGGGTA